VIRKVAESVNQIIGTCMNNLEVGQRN